MHFRSLIIGAFLLSLGLHVSASPIPEAAFESYIKIKGAKDSREPENISVRMMGSWLDRALKVRDSLWRPLLRRAHPLKRSDDWNTPVGDEH